METKNPFTVAVVGRPNVGKSKIFNRIVGKSLAIVEDEEGVTRDLIEGYGDAFGKRFRIIDTGGIDVHKKILFHEEIFQDVMNLVSKADLILFVVDGQVGMTHEDEAVVRFIRNHHLERRVWLVVNKVDRPFDQESEIPFYALDFEKVFSVSAAHGHKVSDLIEEISHLIPEEEKGDFEEEICEVRFPKVAIVGRPNVGKSTMMNALISEDRALVSDLAGTTRDALDIFAQGVIWIDTAGIRKKKSEKTTVEKYAYIRSERAIERADICLFLIDAVEGFTAFEKRIATMIEEKKKGCILFINKWDKVKEVRMEHVRSHLKKYFPFLAHAPIMIGSAQCGRNVDQIPKEVFSLFERLSQKIQTSLLNRFFAKALQVTPPPAMDGKRLRVYYALQVSQNPVILKLFVNYAYLLPAGYQRYLINQLYEEFSLDGVPVYLKIEQKIRRERSKKYQKVGSKR